MFKSFQLELNLLTAIDILSAASAFMLGLLFIISRSKNRKANIFLGLTLWCLFGELIDVLSQHLLHEEVWVFQVSLFTIPMLLLYINQTINSSIKLWYLLLFLPGIIANLLSLIVMNTDILRFFEYLFNISILLFILSIIKKHREIVNNFYSDLEHKTLEWIKVIVFIFIGFHVIWIVEDLVAIQSEHLVGYFADASRIFTLFMVFWIGHNGISQSEIFKQKLFLMEGKDGKIVLPKIEESFNSDKDLGNFKNLCLQIDTNKIYTNPKLNLRILSEAVNLNEKEISRLINQQANLNFYQFINQFRVNEFKVLLESPKASQLSMVGLAEEAGFNSKSTFYTAFKSLEGITPRQYELLLKKSE